MSLKRILPRNMADGVPGWKFQLGVPKTPMQLPFVLSLGKIKGWREEAGRHEEGTEGVVTCFCFCLSVSFPVCPVRFKSSFKKRIYGAPPQIYPIKKEVSLSVCATLEIAHSAPPPFLLPFPSYAPCVVPEGYSRQTVGGQLQGWDKKWAPGLVNCRNLGRTTF